MTRPAAPEPCCPSNTACYGTCDQHSPVRLAPKVEAAEREALVDVVGEALDVSDVHDARVAETSHAALKKENE